MVECRRIDRYENAACRRCTFWEATAPKSHKGLCRCQPPRWSHAGSPEVAWPTTTRDDWCGAFAEDVAVTARDEADAANRAIRSCLTSAGTAGGGR